MLAVSARPGAIASHGSARNAARRRSQHAPAPRASAVRGISSTNSSPPVRATTSSARSCSTQQLGDADEHAVADRVAEAVVDRLEVVEVEHGEAPTGPRERCRRPRASR